MQSMKPLDAPYWSSLYENESTGWDIGYPAPALVDFLDRLPDKSIRILIPGAGRGWEVDYAYRQGFGSVYYLDFATPAAALFKKQFPLFPADQVIVEDFFNMNERFDLILEHTFFCSLQPLRRREWARQCFQLLRQGGKIAGLLFNHEFGHEGPPYGGTETEYRELLSLDFDVEFLELCTKSIKPRAKRELFFVASKKSLHP
jgi:methyl halide transferase